MVAGELELGRQAFERGAWQEACRHLGADGSFDALGPDDLERLAIAAHLVGHDDITAQALQRAHVERARRDDAAGAARCAFWLGFSFLLMGQHAKAGGWLARASRFAADAPEECAARGLVLIPQVMEALATFDLDRADALARTMLEIAEHCGDADLEAFGLLCQGEALIARGEAREGVRRLDEAMVAVTTGELSPVATGILYCAVIAACVDSFELQRAAEWTEALDGWCRDQPDAVPYRGACLVHRSQVLQARGAWDAALAEAERACTALGGIGHPGTGQAWYQLGEVLRMRGALADAEVAYVNASGYGREPAPGLALLRLAQGHGEAAVAAVTRMVAEARGLRTLPVMLTAAVEIHLATGDVDAAEAAARELATLAAGAPPVLQAQAASAEGAAALARGRAGDALALLRRALATWAELDMPYEAARVRVQLAQACEALGDHDASERELGAARAAFARLGANADLAGSTARDEPSVRPDGLSARECEVLRIVATGSTNREIAAVLGISEHTVARHLQNIFVKLNLSSRAAAAAYAHAHGLA